MSFLTQTTSELTLLETSKIETMLVKLLCRFLFMPSDVFNNFINPLLPLPAVWLSPAYLLAVLPGHMLGGQASV